MPVSDTKIAIYDSILNDVLRSELNVNDRFDYIVISFFYKKSLDLAKAGQMQESKYYLEKADTLGQTISDPIVTGWLKLYLIPKKAFYYFKTKDFNQAKALTLECLDLCKIVEEKGHEFILHARIQQTFNLARIEMYSCNMLTGLQRCSACLVELFLSYKVDTESRHETLLIGNLYQIVIKSMETILKVSNRQKTLITIWLSALFHHTLEISHLITQSSNCKFREIIVFIQLFGDLILNNLALLSEYAAQQSKLVNDSHLIRVLSAYLELVEIRGVNE